MICFPLILLTLPSPPLGLPKITTFHLPLLPPASRPGIGINSIKPLTSPPSWSLPPSLQRRHSSVPYLLRRYHLIYRKNLLHPTMRPMLSSTCLTLMATPLRWCPLTSASGIPKICANNSLTPILISCRTYVPAHTHGFLWQPDPGSTLEQNPGPAPHQFLLLRLLPAINTPRLCTLRTHYVHQP